MYRLTVEFIIVDTTAIFHLLLRYLCLHCKCFVIWCAISSSDSNVPYIGVTECFGHVSLFLRDMMLLTLFALDKITLLLKNVLLWAICHISHLKEVKEHV